MEVNVQSRQVAGFLSVCLVIAVMVLGQGTRMDVHATTIYSYTDDKGTPVFTDDLQNVPEKYKSKVQQFEQKSGPKSGQQSGQVSIADRAKEFSSKLGSFRINISGLSGEQTTVLNCAGAAAIVLLITMYLCKESPMIRLLALGLLIVIGIGTPVLMYSGEGGALSVMKKKADESAQLQDKRLKQVSPQ